MLLPAFLLLLVSACKKNSDGSGAGSTTPHATFKLDGNAKSYSGSAIATVSNGNISGSNGYTMTIVLLKNANTASLNFVGIVLNSTKPFATGQAYTQAFLPGSFLSAASLSYMDEVGALYITLNPATIQPGQVTVTLNSLTSTSASGTFSGQIYDGGGTGFSHTITEGEFTVQVKN